MTWIHSMFGRFPSLCLIGRGRALSNGSLCAKNKLLFASNSNINIQTNVLLRCYVINYENTAGAVGLYYLIIYYSQWCWFLIYKVLISFNSHRNICCDLWNFQLLCQFYYIIYSLLFVLQCYTNIPLNEIKKTNFFKIKFI